MSDTWRTALASLCQQFYSIGEDRPRLTLEIGAFPNAVAHHEYDCHLLKQWELETLRPGDKQALAAFPQGFSIQGIYAQQCPETGASEVGILHGDTRAIGEFRSLAEAAGMLLPSELRPEKPLYPPLVGKAKFLMPPSPAEVWVHFLFTSLLARNDRGLFQWLCPLRSIPEVSLCRLATDPFIASSIVVDIALDTTDRKKHREEHNTNRRGGRPAEWDDLFELFCQMQQQNPAIKRQAVVNAWNQKHPTRRASSENLKSAIDYRRRQNRVNKKTKNG